MAVKRRNTAAIVGTIFGVVGGILLFTSFSSFAEGVGFFLEALSYTEDFGIAFEAAVSYTGGRFLVGLVGIVLMIIGFLAMRSSAGQAARDAASKGSEMAQRAQGEAQRRAQDQQRELAQRAQQAKAAAERRAQEFRQRQAQQQSGHPGQQSSSRMDQLRQRVAENPRMQQLREAADQAGYGDLVDRYVPGQPNPQQTRPQQSVQQQPYQQLSPEQRAQQATAQRSPRESSQQQPGARTAERARQARERLAAKAREAGMSVPDQVRPASVKRQSALTRTSLSGRSLVRTSLSTDSLSRTRRRDPLQTMREQLEENR